MDLGLEKLDFCDLLFSQKVGKKQRHTYLTLCLLMEFPIHIDTISMGLPIVYFKGSHVKLS